VTLRVGLDLGATNVKCAVVADGPSGPAAGAGPNLLGDWVGRAIAAPPPRWRSC
jgi:hypothetical protein